jgi:hypothetical protein
MKLIKQIIFCGGILIALQIFLSCSKPQPIPKEKEQFIGVWQSKSNFRLEIHANGIANVSPIIDQKHPDYNKLDVGITPEYAAEMYIGFIGDTVLELLRPQLRYRAFRIDKNPYLEDDTVKFVLNGVILKKVSPQTK